MQKCNMIEMCGPETIKKRIDLLLLENDKVRADLASKIPIDESTLCKKMNGYVEWKLSDCIGVANFFNKKISEIFLIN